MFSKHFASLPNKKHVFEAFFVFAKKRLEAFLSLRNKKNRVLDRFPPLQNEKIRFGSVYDSYKMKKHYFKAFFFCLHIKNMFLKPFASLPNEKMNHVFEALCVFTK